MRHLAAGSFRVGCGGMLKALMNAFGTLAIGVATLVGAFLVLCTLGMGLIFWDVHSIKAFCAEVQPGLSLSQLASIADRHWVGSPSVERPGIFDEQTRDWVFFVPASLTLGDIVCAIHHDKVSVKSAVLWGDSAPEK